MSTGDVIADDTYSFACTARIWLILAPRRRLLLLVTASFSLIIYLEQPTSARCYIITQHSPLVNGYVDYLLGIILLSTVVAPSTCFEFITNFLSSPLFILTLSGYNHGALRASESRPTKDGPFVSGFPRSYPCCDRVRTRRLT